MTARPAQPRRCVVIGAGVLGASVAAMLAGAGTQVTLLDQDRPGRATSRWSLAWLNSNDKGPRPYHDLSHAGISAWAELAPADHRHPARQTRPLPPGPLPGRPPGDPAGTPARLPVIAPLPLATFGL